MHFLWFITLFAINILINLTRGDSLHIKTCSSSIFLALLFYGTAPWQTLRKSANRLIQTEQPWSARDSIIFDI